jgi:hypothetical protein
MLDRPADRIAALLALAAIALGLVGALAMGIYGWAFLAGAVGMLVVGGWWLSRQRPGTPFRELALPVSVATVMPIVGAIISTAAFRDPSVAALPWLLVRPIWASRPRQLKRTSAASSSGWEWRRARSSPPAPCARAGSSCRSAAKASHECLDRGADQDRIVEVVKH